MTTAWVAICLWAFGGMATVLYGIRQARRRLNLLRRIRGRSPEPSRAPRRLAPDPRMLLATAFGIAALLGWSIGRLVGMAAGAAVVGAGAFIVRRTVLMRRRRQTLASLPDFLAALAAGLRAGGSVRQVVHVLAAETPGPLGAIVREGLRREDVGYSLDQVFDELGRTERIAAFRLLGVALAVQRRTGGSLAHILDTLVASLREREQLAEEVRALTAQGRLSMLVLAGLPPALALMVAYLDPSYLDPLWTTTPGHLLLAYALVSLAVGLVVIHRMVQRV
jgi:tight adherence protein B